LIGAGITPSTGYVPADIEKHKDGGLITDPFLQTSDRNIFAAGDIAHYPYWYNASLVRIEHYVVALEQGSHAAFNMLDKMVPYGAAPFFWTRHYNKSI